MAKRTLVSFDWAAKYLLRQKVNFDIWEGFLSETLNLDYALELRYEKLKCNKSDIYIRKA